MKPVRQWCLAAAQQLDVPIGELAANEADALRRFVAAKYAREQTHWLWEYFDNFAPTQDPSAWQWVTEFISGNEAILFFNSGDDHSVFVFPDGAYLAPILAEVPFDEFYVTSETGEYLLAFNHHDILYALGLAKPWLHRRVIR